jgi:hypothetical protein
MQESTGKPVRRYRRQEAARYLAEVHGIPTSPKTLAKKAVIGGGPKFRKAGRIPLYEEQDLDSHAAEILSPPVRSTSELQRRSPIAGCAHGDRRRIRSL